MKQITAILIIIVIIVLGMYYFYQTYKQSAITESTNDGYTAVKEEVQKEIIEKVYSMEVIKDENLSGYRAEDIDLDFDGIYETFLFHESGEKKDSLLYINNKSGYKTSKFGIKNNEIGGTVQLKLAKDNKTGELVHLMEQIYTDGPCGTSIELSTLTKKGNKIECKPILFAECDKEAEEETYEGLNEDDKEHIMRYEVEGKEVTDIKFMEKAKEIAEKYTILSNINEAIVINYGSIEEEIIIGGNENIILYNGTPIASYPRIADYGYTLYDNEESRNKYNIDYYNYENNKFISEKTGKIVIVLGDEDGNGGVVQNVNRIAMSKEIEVFPRDIKKVTNIREEKLENYNIVYECDLDDDDLIEYLCIEYGEIVPVEENEIQNEMYTHKYTTKIDLLDSDYKIISNLIIFNDYVVEDDSRDPIYLENIDIMDIDNDGIMEILIDLLGYEQGGNVAIYKYEKGKIYGKTNYVTTILP